MSQIDPSKPVYGKAYTSEVRQNFLYAKQEIEALEYNLSVSPVLSFNTRVGNVVLNSPDVVNALTYTPAALDNTGKILTSQLPSSLTGTPSYKGSWNASTNVPVMASGALVGGVLQPAGNYYLVSVSGTTAPIDGITTWVAGDWISSSGTVWQRIQNSTSPYLPLTGGALTGNLSITGTLASTSTASLGTGGASHIDISGGTSGTIAVLGGTNAQLVLRSLGNSFVNIGSSTGGAAVFVVPAATNGDTFRITQPAVVGTAVKLDTLAGIPSGGIDFLNTPISLHQTFAFSGKAADFPRNKPWNVVQAISGVNSDVPGSPPTLNNWITDYVNFKATGGIRTFQVIGRMGAGSTIGSNTVFNAISSQVSQPLKVVDIAWQANHAYSVLGDTVTVFGAQLRLTTAGTSGATEPPAVGFSTINDGTCVWANAGNLNTFNQGIAANIAASANYNLGGTSVDFAVGAQWGMVLGNVGLPTATFYSQANALEVDDYWEGTANRVSGITLVKAGNQGLVADWGISINASGVPGYRNALIFQQAVDPNGYAIAFQTQSSGSTAMHTMAGAIDMLMVTPNGSGPGGGGFFLRGPGIIIDQAANLFLNYGGIRPTATGLTIDARRYKCTAVASIVTPGTHWDSSSIAQGTDGSIVRVITDHDDGGVISAVVVVAGYANAAPTGPVTFSRIGATTNTLSAGSGSLIGTSFTANLTYTALPRPAVSLGGKIALDPLTNAVNDAAAATAGVLVNELYRNGSIVMQRVA